MAAASPGNYHSFLVLAHQQKGNICTMWKCGNRIEFQGTLSYSLLLLLTFLNLIFASKRGIVTNSQTTFLLRSAASVRLISLIFSWTNGKKIPHLPKLTLRVLYLSTKTTTFPEDIFHADFIRTRTYLLSSFHTPFSYLLWSTLGTWFLVPKSAQLLRSWNSAKITARMSWEFEIRRISKIVRWTFPKIHLL